jgi:uncharacterized protein (TIGR02246 family)
MSRTLSRKETGSLEGEVRIDDLAGEAKTFEDAFNFGDVEGLVGLYELDAVFVPEPGQVARGRDEIRDVLRDFLAAKPRFKLERKSLHVVGDTGGECAE